MTHWMHQIHSEEGFTYIEVIGAFIIFGLMFVFILRLGDSVYEMNRASTLENQMVHMAELQIENYKSGISDISSYLNRTGISLDSTSTNGGEISKRVLSHEDLDGQYTLLMTDERQGANLALITVTISANNDRINPVTFQSQIIIDTE